MPGGVAGERSATLTAPMPICGVPRVCGGFCGSLRTSPHGPIARQMAPFALSCPFFSRPASRQNFEVRKHGNSDHYRSIAYSRTFQAVGWCHCLGGENHQLASTIRPWASDVAAYACSIWLMISCAEDWAAASCYAPMGLFVTPSRRV